MTSGCLALLLITVAFVVVESCTERQLRLVNRRGEMLKGYRKTTNARVEVCIYNKWGTICDDYFDIDAARNCCQQLELPYHYAGGIFKYGGGSGSTYDMDCKNPDECYYYEALNCSHDEDVGLRCYEEPECEDGKTRLVTDKADYVGLVELCVSGLWRSICSGGWDYRETDVLCYQLNFNGWSFPVSANDLDVEFHDYLTVHCKGNENELGQCEYEFTSNCQSWGPAGAYCNKEECDNGATVLVGGAHPYYGRVEYCYEGQWYTLCADDWDYTGEEARVICENIVYVNDGRSKRGSAVIDYYGRGEHPILPFNIHCEKTDGELSQCSTSATDVSQCSQVAGVVCEINCNSEACTQCDSDCKSDNSSNRDCSCTSKCFSMGNCCEDASVMNCIERECDSGAVRLVGGQTDSVGALEVCVSGIWGRVCQNHGVWNYNNAQVICRQLKYAVEGAELLKNSSYVSSSRRDFRLGGVNCVGTELEILQCQHYHAGHHYCYDSGDTPIIRCKDHAILNVEQNTIWSVMAIFPTLIIFTVLTVIFICIYLHIKKRRVLSKMQQDIMATSSNNTPPVGLRELTREAPPVAESVSQPLLDSNPPTQDTKSSTQVVSTQREMLYCNKYDNISSLLLSSDHVIIIEPIGEGIFGFVYKGRLKKSQDIIAVKTFNGDYDRFELDSLVEEASKMNKFDHLHVMGIIGISLDTDSAPFLIMPYMENGSLLDYLQKKKTTLIPSHNTVPEEVEEISRRLLEMCRQIASGMEYLASLKYVHRDLAARNCMIDGHFIIKVSDFGLSEDVFEKNYLRLNKSEDQGLCVKWMALESLAEGFFSEKSDVWSYGVTMWEIFSGGETPSYSNDTNLALLQCLQEGKRLPQPCNPACSNKIVKLMKQCWEEEAKDRPSFETLHSTISGFLERMSGYLQLESNPFLEHTAGTND